MTPDEKRLALHIFNSRGKSILTQDHQEERIRKLEQENLKLKRLLKQSLVALKSEKAKPLNAELLN